MIKMLTALTLAFLLVDGSAFAQDAAQDASSPSPQNSIKLVGVLADLPTGTTYLSVRMGTVFCHGETILRTWTDGRAAQKLSLYLPAFKTELEAAGYKVITPGEDNLFDEEAGASDYEAAAVITDEHITGCVSSGSIFADSPRGSVEGDSAMKIDWQIYSRLKKQVVAHVSTSGTSKLDKAVPGGVARLVTTSFAENVRQLAQNADFRAAMTAPKAFTAGFQMPGAQAPIALAGNLKAGPRKIADATASVVAIVNSMAADRGFSFPRTVIS